MVGDPFTEHCGSKTYGLPKSDESFRDTVHYALARSAPARAGAYVVVAVAVVSVVAVAPSDWKQP